jgi:hypothetical protein
MKTHVLLFFLLVLLLFSCQRDKAIFEPDSETTIVLNRAVDVLNNEEEPRAILDNLSKIPELKSRIELALNSIQPDSELFESVFDHRVIVTENLAAGRYYYSIFLDSDDYHLYKLIVETTISGDLVKLGVVDFESNPIF